MMMIKESLVAEFQARNKESDIMGVVRTLYPKIEITLKKSKKAKKK
jgi:hypothetical protein